MGKFVGFPIPGRCDVQRDCKLPAIKKAQDLFPDEDTLWYLGIAKDEPKRLLRLKENQVSLLDRYGYTEKNAEYLCRYYGLYSPHYDFARRGGVLFLPQSKRKRTQALQALMPGPLEGVA